MQDNQTVKGEVKAIADIHGDFTQWYTDVVLKTRLVDYGPVKGTMVIRPYGYAIWEAIQRQLDERIKATGHVNCYFPMLIPKSFLLKEAEHVEGFAPECATVTHVGDAELPEPLVIRPTSETIICEMFALWVQSYRDLPLLYNQWANVIRWEKTTRPFLRTSEFLWQEGHTIHASREEAEEETLRMLRVYEEFARNVLAVPVLIGRKTDKEKFAGAAATYSMEAMMLDGKALQAGTSHFLGQNFARAFDIRYLDRDNTLKYVWQSSWGVSTRLIGALIMAHGDERGLVLPPRVAPVQAVIIPIAAKKPGVLDRCTALAAELKAAGYRVKTDDSDNSPGWKFAEHEMKGVPVRIELGPRDLENGVVTVARRDTGAKFTLPLDGIGARLGTLLDEIHDAMLAKAQAFLDAHIVTAHTFGELRAAVENQCFALSMWCGDPACEQKVKEETAATSRNLPFDQSAIEAVCPICGRPARHKIYWGRAY